jgi:hypothetical protein
MFLKKELLQNHKMEIKVMKKQLLIIGITLILLTVGFSGCTENNSNNNITSKTNEKKIIGQWTGTSLDSTQTITFNFYANESCILTVNEKSEWATYTMTNQTLATIQSNNVTTTFEYSFSDNDNTLTLTVVGTESVIVFTRQ